MANRKNGNHSGRGNKSGWRVEDNATAKETMIVVNTMIGGMNASVYPLIKALRANGVNPRKPKGLERMLRIEEFATGLYDILLEAPGLQQQMLMDPYLTTGSGCYLNPRKAKYTVRKTVKHRGLSAGLIALLEAPMVTLRNLRRVVTTDGFNNQALIVALVKMLSAMYWHIRNFQGLVDPPREWDVKMHRVYCLLAGVHYEDGLLYQEFRPNAVAQVMVGMAWNLEEGGEQGERLGAPWGGLNADGLYAPEKDYIATLQRLVRAVTRSGMDDAKKTEAMSLARMYLDDEKIQEAFEVELIELQLAAAPEQVADADDADEEVADADDADEDRSARPGDKNSPIVGLAEKLEGVEFQPADNAPAEGTENEAPKAEAKGASESDPQPDAEPKGKAEANNK